MRMYRHYFLLFLACAMAMSAMVTSNAARAAEPSTERTAERNIRQQVLHLRADDGRDVAAILTMPAGGINTDAPAIVHCQGGPGGTPLEGSGVWIAEGLAAQGYTVLAPAVRHADQLFTANFDEMERDVKATVDQLHALGFRKIVLAGSSFGSITITRYVVDTKDPRIGVLLHFAPTADMSTFVRRAMGDEAYLKVADEAARLVSEGKGMSTVFAPGFDAAPPFPPHTRIRFTHTAQRWLDLWGPASTGMNTLLFPQIHQPMLLLLGEKDGYNSEAMLQRLKASATGSPRVDTLYVKNDANHSFYPVANQVHVVAEVANWLTQVGYGVTPATETRVLTINEQGNGFAMRRALQYAPVRTVPAKAATAFLILHDWNDDAFSSVAQWLGPQLAQAGYTAVSPNAVRGDAELMRNTLEQSDKIIKAWVDALASRGFRRVILIGHGYGSNRASHYLAVSKDARIAGQVYLAPPPDAAAWMRNAVGKDAYATLLAQARAQVALAPLDPPLLQWTASLTPAAMPTTTPITTPITTPTTMPTTTAAATQAYVMLPDAFLATWGPDAYAFSAHLAKASIPTLLLGAEHDAYLAPADFNRLARAANGSTSKLLPGEHRFAGAELQVSAAITAWSGQHD